jgi:gliding motility-associatede transport system auxiliary component
VSELPRDQTLPPDDDKISFVLALLSGLMGLLLILGYLGVQFAQEKAGIEDLSLGKANYALAVGVGLLILGIGLQFDRVWDLVRQRRTVHAVNAVLLSLLAVCLFGLVNYVSARHNVPKDLTGDRLYSLGEDSLAVARTLGSEVKIVSMLPPAQEGMAERVDVLLEQYRAAAPDRITIETLQPYKLTPEEMKAKLEELELSGRSDAEILGLVVQSGRETEEGWVVDKSRHLPITELWREEMDQANQGEMSRVFQGEQKVTTALLEVTEERKPKVYFLTGHDEISIVSMGDQNTMSVLAQELRQKNIDVEALDTSLEPKIPDDADVLVVPGPRRPLSDGEVTAIEDYLAGGGDMIVFLEPVVSERDQNVRYVQTGLERVLQEEYGIAVEDRRVVSPQARFGRTSYVDGYPSPAHHITRPLTNPQSKYFLADYPRALIPISGFTKAKVSPLLETHPDAGQEVYYSIVDVRRLDENTERRGGPFTLAAASERLIPLADRPPPAAERGPVSAAEAQAPVSRVVVVGDLEFITDGFTLNPTVGNLELVYNSVQWTLHQEARAVGQVHRPPTYRLHFQEGELALLMLLSLGMPLVAVGLGVFVWLMRR